MFVTLMFQYSFSYIFYVNCVNILFDFFEKTVFLSQQYFLELLIWNRLPLQTLEGLKRLIKKKRKREQNYEMKKKRERDGNGKIFVSVRVILISLLLPFLSSRLLLHHIIIPLFHSITPSPSPPLRISVTLSLFSKSFTSPFNTLYCTGRKR